MSAPALPPSPLRSALFTQVAAVITTFALVWLARNFMQPSLLTWAVVQGLCAAFISWRLAAPRWWWLIHLVFMPLVVVALAINIAPGWYLAAFVLTLFVFWRTDKSRVPLYLSNAATATAVATLLPPAASVIDLGCGDGRLLHRLSIARPDCNFIGIEHAPLPWLLARLANLRRPNVEIRYGNFWHLPLTPFDVVYAFLSPAPMSALGHKARTEMAVGKLLITNSFFISGWQEDRLVIVEDRRQSHLFCYKTGLERTPKPQN